MTTLSKVYFAYTRDGQQFDSMEALTPEDAHADIVLTYGYETNFMLRGEWVDIEGFTVAEVPVPVGLHRDVRYWSHRFICCADPIGTNGKWVAGQLKAAMDAMMRLVKIP